METTNSNGYFKTFIYQDLLLNLWSVSEARVGKYLTACRGLTKNDPQSTVKAHAGKVLNNSLPTA